MTTDIQAQIAEALADHGTWEQFRAWDGRNSRYDTVCGTCGNLGDVGGDAHQAEMLAPLIREAQAGALYDAAQALEDFAVENFDGWLATEDEDWLRARAASVRGGAEYRLAPDGSGFQVRGAAGASTCVIKPSFTVPDEVTG